MSSKSICLGFLLLTTKAAFCIWPPCFFSKLWILRTHIQTPEVLIVIIVTDHTGSELFWGLVPLGWLGLAGGPALHHGKATVWVTSVSGEKVLSLPDFQICWCHVSVSPCSFVSDSLACVEAISAAGGYLWEYLISHTGNTSVRMTYPFLEQSHYIFSLRHVDMKENR